MADAVNRDMMDAMSGQQGRMDLHEERIDGLERATALLTPGEDGGSQWVPMALSGPQRTAVVTGLDNDAEYEVQVRARNALGQSPWGPSGTGTPRGGASGDVDGPGARGAVDLSAAYTAGGTVTMSFLLSGGDTLAITGIPPGTWTWTMRSGSAEPAYTVATSGLTATWSIASQSSFSIKLLRITMNGMMFTVHEDPGIPDQILTSVQTGTFTITPPVAPSWSVKPTYDRTWILREAAPVLAFPAVDAGDPPISYAVSGLPQGMSLVVENGIPKIGGTPVEVGAGTATLTATNAGGSDTLQLTWTVLAPVGMPYWANTVGASQSWVEGVAITDLAVPATEPVRPLPAYSATGLPDGLAFDAATRVVSGTPTATGSGTITITATNNQGSGTLTYAWVVAGLPDAPGPPVVTPGQGRLAVSWSEPNGNNSPITGYSLRYRKSRFTGLPRPLGSGGVALTVAYRTVGTGIAMPGGRAATDWYLVSITRADAAISPILTRLRGSDLPGATVAAGTVLSNSSASAAYWANVSTALSLHVVTGLSSQTHHRFHLCLDASGQLLLASSALATYTVALYHLTGA